MRFNPAPRTRISPFYDKTVEAGATAVTVYNHMILPSSYDTKEEEYDALINGVAIWDVAVERQVEIMGPDAARLTQYLCTRDISKMKIGAGRYTFVCNYEGGILNDPVLLKLADDHFWLSLADNDIGLWAQAIGAEGGYDCVVREPDVSPVQVQGPKSLHLIRDAFGDEIAQLGYYRFAETDLEGIPVVVSRTGWSGEFGYEVWLRDSSRGPELWDSLFAAGEPYGAIPGVPNTRRRIEGGILSYGTDMDPTVNPFEVGFDRLVNFATADDFVGRAALEQVAANGVTRRLTGIKIPEQVGGNDRLLDVSIDGEVVGYLTSMTWSPRFEATVGFVMVPTDAGEGVEVTVQTTEGPKVGTTEPIPFVESVKD
jgi:aminomethyltransferase